MLYQGVKPLAGLNCNMVIYDELHANDTKDGALKRLDEMSTKVIRDGLRKGEGK